MEASFLRWDALPVWIVQLASPPKPTFTSILHELQYLVLDAVNSESQMVAIQVIVVDSASAGASGRD